MGHRICKSRDLSRNYTGSCPVAQEIVEITGRDTADKELHLETGESELRKVPKGENT